jgi:hypothetical protein
MELNFAIIIIIIIIIEGRDSSVGIAARYGLGGPVGARFSAPVQTGPVVHPVSCTIGIESISRG